MPPSDRGPGPMTPSEWKVVGRRTELPGVRSLDLAPVVGPAPGFLPGQFTMLYAFGVGEIPVSISGNPGRAGVLTHTIRGVGGVSRALIGLRKGESVGVRGPFGTPWPVDGAVDNDVVIVAGGLGLAPVRPIIHRVLADRDRFGRVVVLYGARTPSQALYLRELAAWRARFDTDVRVTVDAAEPGWRGNVGVVTHLVARAGLDPLSTTAFVCGPEVMMRFAALELGSQGVDPGRIFLSLERNMKCAVGFCGHCQFGKEFVCKDGPVFSLERISALLGIREI